MTALRRLVCFASAVAATIAPAAPWAQSADNAPGAWQAGWNPAIRSSLGLQLESVQAGAPCPVTALVCDARDRTAHLRAGAMVGRYWGLQLGYADSGRIPAGEGRALGMNFSLVGKAPLGASFDVFGKLGTTYSRPDTAVLGAGGDPGFGLSFGAGLRFAFTPRLSATVEWDSNDFRFPGTGREPVRSTSLGLQYRY
jgi:OOP family OmpA-OmpF porin